MATQNSINSPIPFAASKGGTGLVSPTAHGIMVGEGSSPMNPIVLTDGQLLFGVTGADPVARTLTAGSGINIDLTVGGVATITNTGGASFTWNDVTGASAAVAVNNGYVTDNASLVTLTLPGTAAFGSIVRIVGKGAGGWLLAQPASVTVAFGDITTTSGVTGSLASTQAGDCIELVCITANTAWRVNTSVGNITYV